jgi:hypothetical protein
VRTIFTVANLNYLNQVLVLAKSIKRHESAQFVLLLIERTIPKELLLIDAGIDEVILVEEIVKDFADHVKVYNVVEASTSVKGAALRYLLNRSNGDSVIYLDPDVALFSDLKELSDLADRSSIALTPHQLAPSETESTIWEEVDSLKYGVFNFGCLAVAPDKIGLEFANWWDARIQKLSFERHSDGLFTDQKWGNLVPIFFPTTAICRDPGINFAHWNLHSRKTSFDQEGRILVNGSPLRMFHFTKGPGSGFEASMVKTSFSEEIAHLWCWYRNELEHANTLHSISRVWSFGQES